MTRRFLTSTLPIHRRLPLLMLLACSATVLVASALYLMHDMLGFRRHMDNQLASIARIVALNSTAALMFQDRDAGAQVLTSLRDEKGIMGVAITEARSITARLTPSGLEELGLMSALKGAATDLLEHTHLDVKLHDNSSGKELSANRRILTFRCVQELMRNISKHANARNVMIELNDGEGALCITVRDDGDGFDPETALSNNRTNGGFGLFSIIERISFAGGTVDLASTPGEGAAITLKLPFAEDGLPQAP